MGSHDPRYYPTRLAAQAAERELNARAPEGVVYAWADGRAGAGARRWQVVRAPVVGDAVLACVGGTCAEDAVYRDAGTVTAVTGPPEVPHARVETSLGLVFHRQGLRPCWRSPQGWTLVPAGES